MSQRVSVVTGGASGIGAACVKHLAQLGDDVVVLDLPGAWQAAHHQVQVAGVLACDVTDDDKLREVARTIEATYGPVGAVVNSAGILQRRLPPDQLTMQEWDRVVAVDQRGTYLACAVFGEAMVRRGHGAIVNIASITASRSVPLHAYAPAKAAVLSITQCLAGEWGRSGVRVNAICPGSVSGPRMDGVIEREAQAVGKTPQEIRTGYEKQVSLQTFIDADDIAASCVFLCSPAARFITGQVLPVDGNTETMRSN